MTNAAAHINNSDYGRLVRASSPRLPAKPFLKWVGGKGRLIPSLTALLPPDVEHMRHVEHSSVAPHSSSREHPSGRCCATSILISC